MKYPDDFDTPTFPAGKRIVVSRLMAIGIATALLCIVGMCGMILWGAASQKMDPFLVSVNKTTGAWEIVGHPHKREHNATYTIQESVVQNFIVNWFAVSDRTEINDMRWELCDADFCKSDKFRAIASPQCAISCVAGSELTENFIYTIVPMYQNLVASGTTWMIDTETWDIEPIGQINENGGIWQISAKIRSNIAGLTDKIDIIAFAQVSLALDRYPQTMGFYISGFNAYRIN